MSGIDIQNVAIRRYILEQDHNRHLLYFGFYFVPLPKVDKALSCPRIPDCNSNAMPTQSDAPLFHI